MMVSHCNERLYKVASPNATFEYPLRALPTFDAYDCPAIVLGDDALEAMEMRTVLQSLGFDVLAGTKTVDVDDEPVLVILSGFLDQPENHLKLQRIKELWPSAPVLTICDPANAAAQLQPFLS